MDFILSKVLGIIGIFLILLILWLISENKKKFPIRIIIYGFVLQFSIAIIILYIPVAFFIFQWIGERVRDYLDFSKKGAEFLFGNVGKAENNNVFGFQFAIIISSTIIFFSAFVSILYKYGIMQKTMKTSGVESLAVASNIFLGQTEAPLLVRHYLAITTRSELITIMTGGFGALVPEKRAEIASLGFKAMFIGVLVNLLTAIIASFMIL